MPLLNWAACISATASHQIATLFGFGSMKKHELFVAGIATLFVVIIVMVLSGKRLYALPTDTGTIAPDAVDIAGDTASSNPGYISYNIPPYNPGALPDIVDNTFLDNRIANNSGGAGQGCCPGCAGDDTVSNDSGLFQSVMGLGNYAGGA